MIDLPLGKRSPWEKVFLLGPGNKQQIRGLNNFLDADNFKRMRFMVIKGLKRIGQSTVIHVFLMAAILNFWQEPFFCHRGSRDFFNQRTKNTPSAKFYASFRK